ncbi:MAG: hypothetical protein M3N23_02730 [Pseudomonadota bacterium]|nr:hypothetical protein [Pseudomonadota bacterium]
MMQARRSARAWFSSVAAVALMLGCTVGTASAQTLDAKFSCSQVGDDGGERVTYADSGEIHLDGAQLKNFRWESSLFRATHGFDCSIDDGDGPQARLALAGEPPGWTVTLADARAARQQRGYDFNRGVDCQIVVQRDAEHVTLLPNCPALCGSRLNFSPIVIDLKTGQCSYR